MIAVLRSVLSIIVAAAAVLFALANRESVGIVWSPVHDPVNIPVFFPALLALMAGFVIGAALVWLNGSVIRKERRAQRKVIKNLEEKLQDIDRSDIADNEVRPVLIGDES